VAADRPNILLIVADDAFWLGIRKWKTLFSLRFSVHWFAWRFPWAHQRWQIDPTFCW